MEKYLDLFPKYNIEICSICSIPIAGIFSKPSSLLFYDLLIFKMLKTGYKANYFGKTFSRHTSFTTIKNLYHFIIIKNLY